MILIQIFCWVNGRLNFIRAEWNSHLLLRRHLHQIFPLQSFYLRVICFDERGEFKTFRLAIGMLIS
ncbi:hypothetical protein AW033_22465 [Vibrio parahaemolyticus]|nr:hypothetical protein [Vibrio parahaemolyticus]KYZ06508.1 hypothetical protein AW033_22465 [Vibrio parahaemolyticus]